MSLLETTNVVEVVVQHVLWVPQRPNPEVDSSRLTTTTTTWTTFLETFGREPLLSAYQATQPYVPTSQEEIQAQT